MPRVLGLSSPAPESHLLPSTKETNVSVSVELRVTNQEFSEDLRNESSTAYQNFVQSFTQQVGHCLFPHGVFSVLVRGVLVLGEPQGGEGTGPRYPACSLLLFQMDIFYRNIEGYQGIKILSLS